MYRDSTVRAMETVRPTMNKILIVDDSATMRKMLRRLLEAAELEVGDLLEAGTGLEALRAVVDWLIAETVRGTDSASTRPA